MADTIYGKTVGGLLMDAAGNVYDAGAGLLNFARNNPESAGLVAGQFVPGAATQDYYGNYPDPMSPQQMLPSARENFAAGNYLDAGFQAMGLLGDAAYAASPFTAGGAAIAGGALSAPRAAQLGARASNIGHNGGPPLVNVAGDVSSVNEPAGSMAMYRGAAPDRSGGSFERYTPARGVPAGMQRLLSATEDPTSPIVQQFDRFIEKGIELKGPDWYNTEELRDWFVSRLGEERGDAEYMDYINLIGATSTGAKVPQNFRMASFYRALAPDQRVAVATLVNEKGMTPKAAAAELGIDLPNVPDNFGYGHIKQRNMASNVLNQERGSWAKSPPEEYKGKARSDFLKANPKVKGFANSLVGDVENIAADIHFMRMLAMSDGGVEFLNGQAKLSTENLDKVREAYGKKKTDQYIATRKVNGKEVRELNLANMVTDGIIKDTELFQDIPQAWRDTPKANEYEALEKMAQNVAARYDMTPAQFQASLWMGAGEMTNLAGESQGTAMELFRRSLDNRAQERGISREEMLKDFIDNKGLLSIPAAGVGAGLLMQQPEEEQQGLF